MNTTHTPSQTQLLDLLQLARSSAKYAYAPYSGFRVGAVVLTTKATYIGVNVENASYGLTLCAERAALAAAVSAGDKDITAIAIACIDAEPTPRGRVPCGACLQWIADLCPQAAIVVEPGQSLALRDLLPIPFGLASPAYGDNHDHTPRPQ